MTTATRWTAFGLLSLLAYLSPVQAQVGLEDPMYLQATSFGWLAIRNFTYCLSSQPDPPNKPRGVQPKKEAYTSLNAAAAAAKVRTGTGDSVVVLYHPENTNKAIAWCNTLVAFESTKHINCHVALPTCQRCDAVRSKKGVENQQAGADHGQSSKDTKDKSLDKAPSAKLGQPKEANANAKAPAAPSTDKGGLVRRGGVIDPDDPLVALPDDTQSEGPPASSGRLDTGPQRLSARPFGSSTIVEADASIDPELEAAIAEFQDYCENKLTLAVRADCPLHIVKGWADEPPFDLQHYCMSMRGSDGSTLHTTRDATLDSNGANARGIPNAGAKQGTDEVAGSGSAGRATKRQDGSKKRKVGASSIGTLGNLDPSDPVVPSFYDHDRAPDSPPSLQSHTKPQQQPPQALPQAIQPRQPPQPPQPQPPQQQSQPS